MHTGIKVLVVLLILLIAFIILVGLIIGWSGESQNIMEEIFGFFGNLLPGSGGTSGPGAQPGGTPGGGAPGGGTSSGGTAQPGTSPLTALNDVHGIKD